MPWARGLQFVLLATINFVAVVAMVLLVTEAVLPVYPGAMIAYVLLFAFDMLWIWRRARHDVALVTRRPASKSMWVVGAVFTVAGMAALFAYFHAPSVPLAVQAVIAVLLDGYIWFLIYIRRSSRLSK